jgi:hypothetical protein
MANINESFIQLQHRIMDFYETRHPSNVRDTIGAQPRPPFITATLLNGLTLAERQTINELIADEIEIANRERDNASGKRSKKRRRKSSRKMSRMSKRRQQKRKSRRNIK